MSEAIIMQRHARCLQCSRLGMSLVETVVTICTIGFLLAMLAPAIQTPRGPSRRMECQTNLKIIALAVHQ